MKATIVREGHVIAGGRHLSIAGNFDRHSSTSTQQIAEKIFGCPLNKSSLAKKILKILRSGEPGKMYPLGISGAWVDETYLMVED